MKYVQRRPQRQIRFTKEGYHALKKQYEELLKDRPDAVTNLQKSRELGDLSENGFYKAARARLSSLDGTLRRLQSTLNRALIVAKTKTDTIGIGNEVIVKDKENEITYAIVGDLEADPKSGKISLFSPIGRALAGRKVGDRVTIIVPSGTITYKILQIH